MRGLDCISESRKQFLVLAVRTDPEPNHHSFVEYAYSPPIEIDSHRVDGERAMNLLEAKRRVRRILCPESIGDLRFCPNCSRRDGQECTELPGCMGLHCLYNGLVRPAA